MQSAVANGKLEGQSVHGHGTYLGSTAASAMWIGDDTNSTSSAAAADCRAIVPMLSGKSRLTSLRQNLHAVYKHYVNGKSTHFGGRETKPRALHFRVPVSDVELGIQRCKTRIIIRNYYAFIIVITTTTIIT